MDLGGLHQLINYLREDFKDFKKNDFAHLEDKVDKLVVKIALIVGAISALTVVANIIARVYG